MADYLFYKRIILVKGVQQERLRTVNSLRAFKIRLACPRLGFNALAQETVTTCISMSGDFVPAGRHLRLRSRLPVDRQDPLHAPSGGDAHSLSLRPLLYSLLKPWGTPQSPDTPALPWPLAVASAQPFSEPQNRRPQTRSLRLLHFMVIEVQAQPLSKTSDGGPGAV